MLMCGAAALVRGGVQELFPCIEVHEQQELFAAVQEMDTNADERISWEEFRKAFAAGGVQQMQVRRRCRTLRFRVTPQCAHLRPAL